MLLLREFKSRLLVLCMIICCWLSTYYTAGVLSENSEDVKIFDGDLFDVGPPDTRSETDIAKMMMLDNQLMKDMYIISTDKVYTLKDIRAMIYAVASRPNMKLNDAVTAVVNLKLIQKLQFRALDTLFAACSDLDTGSEIKMDANPHSDEQFGVDESGKVKLVTVRENEPACISRFSDAKTNKDGNCSQESCRFYLHCVLHKRQCSESILELASNYLMSNKTLAQLPFATGDRRTDRRIAKAIAMSQYAEPDAAIKFATEVLDEEGESVGLLQARALAYARSGIKPEVVELIVDDVNLALSLDATNERSIYRKAAVLLSVAHYIEALEALEIGLALYPNNPDFYEMKGSCHFQLQDLSHAEYNFRRALELNVDNQHGALQKLGLVLYRQGKLANAVTVYKDLLQLNTKDSNTLISIAHSYRQQGEGGKALQYADKAVKFEEKGKIQLLFRGSLHHSLGHDHKALLDFQLCLEHHSSHELCMYHAGLSYANLGLFYEAVKCMVGVTSGMDPTSPNLQPNSHYIKASYLTNYYRYLHSKLDQPLAQLRLDQDLRPAFKDGWAKGSPLDMSEYFACEQSTLSPDIPPVVSRTFSSYPADTRRLLCKAQRLGKLMQVKADSFLPNDRFNLAMGLAAIDVGQRLRKSWVSVRRSGVKRLTWRQLYEISLSYRRLADLEIPILWLSMIYKEEHIGYHNEVSFYRSQVRNLRMKSYFDLVFGLTRSMIKQQIAMEYPQHTERQAEIEVAKCPEDLVSIAKTHIPTQISTTVPSATKANVHFDGGMIVLTQSGYGGASLYMNIPTTHSKTQDYDQELGVLYNRVANLASKLRTNNLDTDATTDAMMTMSYYFFNLCPFSRGSASVGVSTLVGMFLSIDKEMTMSFPAGKMLDMEATLSGGAPEFIFGTKDWFKLVSTDEPITSLPLVSDTFPTVRTMLEVLPAVEDMQCDRK